MKKGLVLEGGAMRGLFSSGVLDVFMENNIEFDGAIGVSAGAAFGCNYKSKQIGRALAYNVDYCKDPRYGSVRSFLKTGNLYEPEFCYREIPFKLNIFDTKTFRENPMEFYVVCTDVETGYGVYHKCTTGEDEDVQWIRASASIPMVSNVVEIGDYKLLDGGVADSIPIKRFEEYGYDRNVIILTQPLSFKKRPASYLPMARIVLRKYPNLVKRMENRHNVYNATLEYIRKKEAAGEVFVIRPPMKLEVSGAVHDPEEMKRVYNMGRKAGEEYLEAVKAFLS